MARERDAYAFCCDACHRDVEVPVFLAGSLLRCPSCGARFHYVPTAPLDDMPDDLQAERQWSERELPPCTGPSPSARPPEKLTGPSAG